MTSRLTLDTEEWGRLVKTWATGQDYVNTPPEQQPPRGVAIPAGASFALPAPAPLAVTTGAVTATIPKAWALEPAAMRALMEAADVTIPPDGGFDAYTHVIIVQGDATTLVLRLPTDTSIRASEDELVAAPPGSPYGLPGFYDQLYAVFSGGVPNPAPSPLSQEDKMRLHANRIADYSMSQCR